MSDSQRIDCCFNNKGAKGDPRNSDVLSEDQGPRAAEGEECAHL